MLVDCTRGLCDSDYNFITFLNKVSSLVGWSASRSLIEFNFCYLKCRDMMISSLSFSSLLLFVSCYRNIHQILSSILIMIMITIIITTITITITITIITITITITIIK